MATGSAALEFRIRALRNHRLRIGGLLATLIRLGGRRWAMGDLAFAASFIVAQPGLRKFGGRTLSRGRLRYRLLKGWPRNLRQCTTFDLDAGVDAANRVAESERLYRLLAENSCDMIVCYGLDLVRRYVSPASEVLLGYRPDELLGRSPISEIHPDDRAYILEAASALRAATPLPVLNYRQRRKDGTYVWLETTYRFVHDCDTGAPEQLIATVRDISRRKAAEEAAAEAMVRARESLRLLTMAERIANVGHWRLDTRANRFFWSPEVFRIYGLEPGGEALRIRPALAAYHPDDQPMVAELMRRATQSGGDFEFAARIFRPNGELRHVVSRGQAEYADGAVTAIFGVLQDVTRQAQTEAARREGEARYRLLAENATDIIFRLDRDGRYLYVSPAVERLTGFRPEDRLLQHPMSIVHEDDRSSVAAALQTLWDGSASEATVDYRVRSADGDWRWLEASGRLAINDGTPEIVGVSRDISARKRFEAELLRAREAAETAARDARLLSETDELTGLANRRMFMRQLDLEIETARNASSPLSLAIFDIDHFKRVNDRHGHAVGDAVLTRIARIAAEAVALGSMIGRLGGEEFALLIPGADALRAAEVGERLRAAIEADAHQTADLPVTTISVGVASLQDGLAASGLLAAADAALYGAKRTGRNKVCVAA